MAIDRRTKVYKIGSTYYAEKHDGTFLSASGTFETVLQAALNQQGLVTIDQDGVFQFNATGVNIPAFTTLHMGEKTVLRVPNTSLNVVALTIGKPGYGSQVDFGTGSGPEKGFSQIIGGRIDRATVQRDWIGVLMYSGNLEADGMPWCTLRDIHVFCPYTGFRFQTAVDGWMSSCDFTNLVAYAPVIGFEFQEAVGSTYGVIRCRFENCSCQAAGGAGSPTVYGFYNIGRKDLTFDDCTAWDMNIGVNPSQRMTVIAANASDIRIRGGAMAKPGGYFVNNSKSRSIFIGSDEWNSPSFGGLSLLDSTLVTNGRRRGQHHALCNLQGLGIFAAGVTAYAGEASQTAQHNFADGSTCRRRTTGIVSGNGAGVRFAGVSFTCRGWNPVYMAKIRLAPTGTTANLRAFFGLTSGLGADATGDDPLTALSGVIFCLRAADTNWQIAHNDGTGATVFTATTIAKGTGIVTLQLEADDAKTNKFRYMIDSGASNSGWVDITSADIPAQSTGLTMWNEIQTAEAAAKSVDIFEIMAETD